MIRLFVGTDCNNCDLESQAVLEYSVRTHASEPVEITWMQNGHGPWAGWQTASMRTPFTHFRWSIPSVCDYKGRAIYCDSDFIFVADIAELWQQDIREPAILLTRNPTGKVRTCCMLLDCQRAWNHIPPVDYLKASRDAQAHVLRYLKEHRHLMAEFVSGDWNCIDLKGYDDLHDPRIKAIHYSRIETQLHLKYAIPRLKAAGQRHWYPGPVGPHWRPELQALFDQLLTEAIAAGYPPERYRVAPHGAYAKRNFTYAVSKVAS